MTFWCKLLYVSAIQAKGAPGHSATACFNRSASSCVVLAEARPANHQHAHGMQMFNSWVVQFMKRRSTSSGSFFIFDLRLLIFCDIHRIFQHFLNVNRVDTRITLEPFLLVVIDIQVVDEVCNTVAVDVGQS